jgi:hypothetical protein
MKSYGSNLINNLSNLTCVLGLALTVIAATRADGLEDLTPQPQPSPAPTLMSSPEDCSTSVETPLHTEQGSVGVMYNLAEHPKSIRAMAKKMLSAATDAAAAATHCTQPCGPAQTPHIVFRVAPIELMPKQKQQPLCLQLAHETRTRPLKYGPHEFPTIEKFDEWIMQFSQGMGPAGKLLYQQCGGDCDPSYTFVIAQVKSGLKVDSEVYCGFARDRKSEMFSMTTALRPRCSSHAHGTLSTR